MLQYLQLNVYFVVSSLKKKEKAIALTLILLNASS